MTGLPRPVSASFHPAIATLEEEVDPVERANVTRSEASAMVDLFWADVEKWRARGAEPYCDATLSFSRDENDFIEFSMWCPERFDARYRYFQKWKLLGFIPMRSTEDFYLEFTTREQAAEFAEAYLATPDPAQFRDLMVRRRATRTSTTPLT